MNSENQEKSILQGRPAKLGGQESQYPDPIAPGKWGTWIDNPGTEPQVGDEVEIRTSTGKTWTDTISRIIWAKDDGSLYKCGLSKQDGAGGPASGGKGPSAPGQLVQALRSMQRHAKRLDADIAAKRQLDRNAQAGLEEGIAVLASLANLSVGSGAPAQAGGGTADYDEPFFAPQDDDDIPF